MIKIINILVVIGFFVVSIILSTQEKKWRILTQKRVTWMLAIFLTIFFGFRDFGLDLEPYKLIYGEFDGSAALANPPFSLFTPTLEPAYTLSISIFKKLGLDYRAFLLFSSGITFSIICWLTCKKSNKPIAIFLIFCLLYLFKVADAVRHGTASALYILGIYFISEQRKIKGISIILLSTLFHYSNVLMLIITPALRIRWKISYYIIASILIATAAIPFGIYLRSISDGQDFYLLWKLAYYLAQQDVLEYQNTLHFLLLSLFTAFAFISTYLLNIYLLLNHRKISDDFHILLLNSQIIGSLIALMFILIGATTIATRILLPAAFGEFILIQHLLDPKKSGHLSKHRLPLVILTLLGYNAIVILYNAGIHYPPSPFFIG